MEDSFDEEIEIDIAKAIKVYDEFGSPTRKRLKGSQESKGRKAILFNTAIQAVLSEMNAPFDRGENHIGSKQTISKWRKNPGKKPVKRRRSVLLAVLALTNVDITKRSILARMPINFSPLVELGPVAAQKLTNDPSEIEEVTYTVDLSSLLLKASRMRVMSSWIKDSDGQDLEVGTVDYGLIEAYLSISFENFEITDWARRIPDEEGASSGRADGCTLLWSDMRECWILQAQSHDFIRARLEAIRLCSVRGPRGAFVDICVTATRDQIDDNFQLKDRRTKENLDLLQEEKIRARERLIGLVLGQKNTRGSVLAMQRYKLP